MSCWTDMRQACGDARKTLPRRPCRPSSVTAKQAVAMPCRPLSPSQAGDCRALRAHNDEECSDNRDDVECRERCNHGIPGRPTLAQSRHCEERSDAAIPFLPQATSQAGDCRALRARNDSKCRARRHAGNLWRRPPVQSRHCEERGDAATPFLPQTHSQARDCRALRARNDGIMRRRRSVRLNASIRSLP